MDPKTQRREAYDRKAHFTHKFQGLYVAKKFPEEIQSLLDVEIPNATLKQLLRFMEKHYKRLTKGQPEVEKALRAVLINRLSKVPEEIRKSQTEKFMKHFEELYPEYRFVKGQFNRYYFCLKDQTQIGASKKRAYAFEEIVIVFPVNNYINVHVNGLNKSQEGMGHYSVFHYNHQQKHQKLMASTYQLHDNFYYQLNPKSMSFQRNVQTLIDKLIEFNERIQRIENPTFGDEKQIF